MTTEKPPAIPQSPQEDAETASAESHQQPETGRRPDQLSWFARILRSTTAQTRIAIRRLSRRRLPRAVAALGQACRGAWTLTRTASTTINAAARPLTVKPRPKISITKARHTKNDPGNDRFAKASLAEVDLWETNITEFSLAKNRVVGFTVGLAAGILVAWFAIGLIERPRLVATPQVATNEGQRPEPSASHVENLSREIWGNTGDAPAETSDRNARTAAPQSNPSTPSGFANHNLAPEAKPIRSRKGSGMTEAALVDRVLKKPPALATERPPPLPSRNSMRVASGRKTGTIELPVPHPARAPAPPSGTIEARSSDRLGDGTRMGIGLGGLTVQRPPPLQRPPPVSSPQSVADP